MNCPFCRARVTERDAYCASCGANLGGEETQFGAAGNQESLQPEHYGAERVVFTARPTLLFIGAGYFVAAVCALLTVIALARVGAAASFSLVVALFFMLVPAMYHFRRNTQTYTLTTDQLEIDRGLIVRTTRHIPLRTVQDVTVSASVFKRLVGIGDVIIENASEGGGATILRNVRAPRRYADLLLRQLRALR